MANIMTDDAVVTLGAATEAQLQHLYERASNRKNPPSSMESFIGYVVDRGIAEIERTWKSEDTRKENEALAKTAAAKLKYLNLKLQHGDTLTEAEEAFMAIFKK